MKRGIFLSLLVVWMGLLVACSPPALEPPVLSAQEFALSCKNDPHFLGDIEYQNAELSDLIYDLKKSGSWKKRGYFSAEESDQLGIALFRLHTIRHKLLELRARHSLRDVSNPKLKKTSQRIQKKANALLLNQAVLLVTAFKGDKVAISKINQRYPRFEIPRNTYNVLSETLESPAHRKLSEYGRKIGESWNDSSYGIQMNLVSSIGEFKNPTAHLIRFSKAQKKQVLDLLEPGDIILTFTAGYASTVFIPGKFKHAMVYVGSVDQRKEKGLFSASNQFGYTNHHWREIQKNLKVFRTDKQRKANVIEAVFEGVKFSNFGHIMDTHMNRMVVFRPRLNDSEFKRYMIQTFSYLGQEYDFRFDFADSSRQVCTEIIYRALNGLNGIQFKLSKHAGYLTLCADDIIHYWMEEQSTKPLRFILFAQEAALSPKHAARIKTGKPGKRKLRLLMKNQVGSEGRSHEKKVF